MGCGCVNRRALTHAGATLPFPGVVQIRERLWGFSLAPRGSSRASFLTALWFGLSSQLTAHFSTDVLCHCASQPGCGEDSCGAVRGRKTCFSRGMKRAVGWVAGLGRWNKAGLTETKCLIHKTKTALLFRTAWSGLAALHNLEWDYIFKQLLNSCSHHSIILDKQRHACT